MAGVLHFAHGKMKNESVYDIKQQKHAASRYKTCIVMINIHMN